MGLVNLSTSEFLTRFTLSSSLLQPVFVVSDPFLNVFRGIVPSIGGFDLSPLLGFFLLSQLTNATAALGCEKDEKKCEEEETPFRLSQEKLVMDL